MSGGKAFGWMGALPSRQTVSEVMRYQNVQISLGLEMPDQVLAVRPTLGQQVDQTVDMTECRDSLRIQD